MTSPATAAHSMAPLTRFLRAPDAPEEGGALSPTHPAAALTIALLGTGVCGAAFALALDAGAGDGLARMPAFALSLPLAWLLCFPPLLLWTALRGAPIEPLRLAAAASAGLGAVGAWLGAAAPVALLFTLSADRAVGFPELPDIAIVLFGLGLGALALGAGARNAVRAGLSLRLRAPGSFFLLCHYGLVLWTAAILFFRLSA